MRTSMWLRHAICIYLLFGAFPATSTYAADRAASVAQYNNEQIARGARTLSIAATLAYRDAVHALREGNTQAAEKKLHEALTYKPDYADAYFTLAQIRARAFDFEATVYMIQAFLALWKDFPAHSLLAVNVITFIPYVVVLVSLIIGFAFAIKYLPFAAHRIREFMQKRFRAAAAGFTTYLLLLIPLVLVPGVITTLAYLTAVCWVFMYRRERFIMLLVITPFIVLGLFGSLLRPLTPLADPKSLTSLIARASHSGASDNLIRDLERVEAEGLEGEKNIALGLAHNARGNYVSAADYFFRAISLQPDNPMGYINLGNVYFMQGQYEKALEGYRKAEGIDPTDPVCQHALAQAYIKTLLMKESSKALQQASKNGIERVKSTYAPDVLRRVSVLPKGFSNAQLWDISRRESQVASRDFLDEVLMPVTRFPREVSAWILIGAVFLALVFSRVIKPSQLTFQCSNCGQLTCSGCCNNEREMDLCQECAKTIDAVTSEKVIEALLRQKRQAVFVSRRKSSKLFTVILPGIRDISYGRVARGLFLATLFSFAVVQILSSGYIVKDSMSLIQTPPLWKLVVAVAGVVLAYMLSVFGKQRYDFRAYRSRNTRHRHRETRGDNAGNTRVA